MIRPPPRSPLFPSPPLSRPHAGAHPRAPAGEPVDHAVDHGVALAAGDGVGPDHPQPRFRISAHVANPSTRRHRVSPKSSPDRKSTRLNSSHLVISYAVFCLK